MSANLCASNSNITHESKFYNLENLSDTRKRLKLTQTDVAQKLYDLDKAENPDAEPLKRQTIGQWESGTVYIPVVRLMQLSKIYGVSMDYLMGLDEDYTNIENAAIGKATGLSNASIETLRKLKDGSRIHKKLKMPLDGLASIRLQILNFLLENENIGLLDTLYNCIFGKFLDDNKYIELDSGTTVIGATNRTLQNAFIPSITVCIEDLRDVAKYGQTKKAHQLIKKRHDAIAAKANK